MFKILQLIKRHFAGNTTLDELCEASLYGFIRYVTYKRSRALLFKIENNKYVGYDLETGIDLSDMDVEIILKANHLVK